MEFTSPLIQYPVGLNVGVNKTTPYNERYQDYIKVIDTFKADVSFLQLT